MKLKWLTSFVIGSGMLLSHIGMAAPEPVARWEVAVLFLGGSEASSYQADVDQNILEIAGLQTSALFRLSVYRDFLVGGKAAFVDSDSSEIHSWSEFVSQGASGNVDPPSPPLKGVVESYLGKGILHDESRLKGFLEKAFSQPDSHRILIVYGHALGPTGLKELRLKPLRDLLEKYIPVREGSGKPLDILWMDACFMASIEVPYELRNISDFFMASEDAEFSSGTPFGILQNLNMGPSNSQAVSLSLAERYLQSYSYMRGGSQSHAVNTSPATLSVIETEKLESLVDEIHEWVQLFPDGQLPPEMRAELRGSHAQRKMDLSDLSDLATFVEQVSVSKLSSPEIKKKAENLLKLLDFEEGDARETNYRVTAVAPLPDSWMVYGYEAWGRGYAGDETFLAKIPAELKPETFLPGPGGHLWPARRVHDRFLFTPFTPDTSDFRYYFVDLDTAEPVTEEEVIGRLRDCMTYEAQSRSNPMLWVGFTEGLGAEAERYSGIAVLDPTLGAANLGYIGLDFAVKTGWGNF